MTSVLKYLIVLVIVALVIAGVFSFYNHKKQNDGTQSAMPTNARCLSSDMAGSLTNAQGTAGTMYYTLQLKNNSAKMCTYKGMVTVRLMNTQNMSLKEATTTIASPLTFSMNDPVYATIGFPAAANYSGSTTCPTGVTKLAIYLPSETNPIIVNGLDALNPGYTNFACNGFSIQSFSTIPPS